MMHSEFCLSFQDGHAQKISTYVNIFSCFPLSSYIKMKVDVSDNMQTEQFYQWVSFRQTDGLERQ